MNPTIQSVGTHFIFADTHPHTLRQHPNSKFQIPNSQDLDPRFFYEYFYMNLDPGFVVQPQPYNPKPYNPKPYNPLHH